MSEKRRGNFISLWTKITQKYDNTEQNMLTRGNSATETMFIIEKSFEKKGKIHIWGKSLQEFICLQIF